MLRWRAATALVLAPIALASIAIGKWAVIVVLLVVIAGAAYELSRALDPLPFVAALGAGALPLLLSIPYQETGVLAGSNAGCRAARVCGGMPSRMRTRSDRADSWFWSMTGCTSGSGDASANTPRERSG